MSSPVRDAKGDLGSTLRRVAVFFRLGQVGAGSEALARGIDLLAELLADPKAAELAPRLLPHLQAALDAQARADHLYVADLLEYELLPAIEGRVDP
ncbi:MAG: hypothetical protein AAGF12_20490 [Myxococcota bacterium]